MGKYRIMIVDDDEDVRRLMALTLRPHYEVVEACDGLDALSKLENYEPDFALIDIMMPLMDGYQVCEAIRRHPRFKTIQVLFLSAYGSKDNIKKSYAAGANLFLTKPIDPERILKNIDFTIVHEPPPIQSKRYTIEQLAELETVRKPHPETPEGVAPTQKAPTQRPPREWHPHEDSIYDVPPSVAPSPPRPAAAHPASPSPAAAPNTPRPRILLVDDDPELLQMLDLALRDLYEITTARNGIEAVEHMVDYQPDLMLIDIMMPKMNGYQLLQSIRRNAYFGLMPVMVLSAKSSSKDREYALRMGATGFMGKPFHIEELLGMLRKATTASGFRIRPKTLSMQEIHSRNVAERSRRG